MYGPKSVSRSIGLTVIHSITEQEAQLSAVVQKADRTAYDALIINHYLDENTLPCSEQHKQNGHVVKKTSYGKYVKFQILGVGNLRGQGR